MTAPTNGPPQVPAPGWTSSEFLATLFVHLVSLAAILLTLLHVHWSKGISAAQAGIPMVALIVSGVLQALYANRRTALKMAYIVNWVKHEADQFTPLADVVNYAAPTEQGAP